MKRISILLSFAVLISFIVSCSSAVSPKKSKGNGEVTYKLVFDATWSSETHPKNFPSNPHFSPLVGALHNKNTNLWTVGKIASNPIKVMAETGGIQELMTLMNNDSNILFTIKGSPIKPSPSQISVNFEVNKTHPYLSLASMLAPSPDWFVGVDSLHLLDSSGEWIDGAVVDLILFDAGTDSGDAFTSSDSQTNPSEPISALNNIKNTDFQNGKPIVGSFTIKKQ